MLNVGRRGNGVTLSRWLLRRPASIADGHDSRESPTAAGVKAGRNRRYDKSECFVYGMQGHKQRGCPKTQQCKEGKGTHGESHGPTPMQQQQQQQSSSSLAQHAPSKTTATAPRPPPLELVRTRPPRKRWLRRPNLLRLKRILRIKTATCTIACRGRS